jgi:hypothetical protein
MALLSGTTSNPRYHGNECRATSAFFSVMAMRLLFDLGAHFGDAAINVRWRTNKPARCAYNSSEAGYRHRIPDARIRILEKNLSSLVLAIQKLVGGLCS